MSNKTLRVTMRWIHIVGAGFIGTYIYSPWNSNSAFTALMQFVIIPVLSLTGIVMWKQTLLKKLIKGKSNQANISAINEN
ncbi:hypothetical protein BLD44_027215 [Mastigocladus laminosus UU774]|nr:hypothetical protein B4U84_27445 [Westiellopsis prolifica IICB1]TFI51216.1 hypothetical protein BLD44_027215 [Mastigocladus laminosus UU774]